MANQPRTRQELYDRIRQSSKDEVILEEMIRLGFWPKEGTLPQDPADEIRRRAELQRQIERLRRQQGLLRNEAYLIAELRKQRLQEAKQRRQETKERRERERRERAEAWRKKKEGDIVYLGEGVSGGLSHQGSQEERLAAYDLPRLQSASEIAAAMGITVGALRFLAFARRTSTISHYRRFCIPKKTGGMRKISAPMPRLKAAQSWILQNILEKIPVHEAAHGFLSEHSIVTNAAPHLGRHVVVNVDLKDFFPTVRYPRVKGLFRALGYSEAAATIFALLCTEPEIEEVELDGKIYFVALSERHLPQGAPTSPYLTNLLCRRMDRRLAKMAAELGFTYTRYADDLSFSGDQPRHIGKLLKRLGSIVAHEGFVVHPQKTRVFHHARRQEVTGVVVNQKPNVPRDTLKRFRALLFQIEKDGPENKHWGSSQNLFEAIQGFANFVYMVNPEKGAALKEQVRALIDKYGWTPPTRERKGAQHLSKESPTSPATAPEPPAPEQKSPSEPPKKKWWKLW